jgi:hypothetical protein
MLSAEKIRLAPVTHFSPARLTGSFSVLMREPSYMRLNKLTRGIRVLRHRDMACFRFRRPVMPRGQNSTLKDFFPSSGRSCSLRIGR